MLKPTADEIAAIKYYTGLGYLRINARLRGDAEPDAQLDAAIKRLDSVLDKSTIKSDTIVFRGFPRWYRMADIRVERFIWQSTKGLRVDNTKRIGTPLFGNADVPESKPKPVGGNARPSPELAAITGKAPLPRSEVISKVWDHMLAILATGCSETQFRMNAQFDTELPGAPPPTNPTPSPPADSFVWVARQPLRSTLEQDSKGGGHIRIVPLQGFLADPDLMRNAMIGVSEPFTTSKPVNMRGKLRVRINGSGDLFFVIRAIQGGRMTDWIGGGTVRAVFGRAGSISVGRPVTDNFFVNGVAPLPGPDIGQYLNGHSVTLNWSINQSGRIFYFSAPGGAESHQFLLGNAPIEKLMIFIYLHHPQTGMVAHIDDITMEETG